MIIWLASYPRSGNGFFRNVCKQLFNLQTYSIYPDDFHSLNSEEITGAAGSREAKTLVKTHELPSDEFKAIYLVRDGRDALVSFTHWTLANELKSTQIDMRSPLFRNQLKTIIGKKRMYFGGWSKHVLKWTNRPNSVIVKFEDLIVDPENTVSTALRAAGFSNMTRLTNAKLEPFDSLHAKNPVLYRKGRIGDWKTCMDKELHELFWKHHGDGMSLLGYSKDVT